MTTNPSIPIANLYYLLAYAWEHFHEGPEIDVAPESCPDIHNLLARVLANGIRRLAQRGMDKGYLVLVEETPVLRGKMMLAESHRRFLHRTGRIICEFDELSADTLPNRILRTTCDRLLHSGLLTSDIRREVRRSQQLLRDITSIHLSRQTFHRVQLHRNNRHYRLLLHVSKLIFESFLPEERSGTRRFHDILKEETIMHRIFEHFVLNFARRHCEGANVRPMRIEWCGEWNEEVDAVLPSMLADVTVELPDRKLILDCKFYREALVNRDGRYRLHSNHLYQLNAYLQNKSQTCGWENVEGMLLYPAVDHRLDLSFTLLGHTVKIKSVDLDQPWQKIESRMNEILGN